MDSLLPDPATLLDRMDEALRAGSWGDFEAMAAKLTALSPPHDATAAHVYLNRLRRTLIQARAARADAQTSLSRIRAAASFNPRSEH